MSEQVMQPAHDVIDHEVKTGSSMPFWAVYKRELAQYFRSPIAYAIAFAMLLFLGFLFNGYLAQASNPQGGVPADPTYLPSLLVFLMFLIGPLLTMRLLAEEAREGTLEVLMTLPMHEGQFIIGKFLAAWTYYTAMLALTLIHYLVLTTLGSPDQGAAFGAYVGAWLYGGAVIAVCMIWSAVTEDQIVAAFLSAATVLVLYLTEVAAMAIGSQNAQLSAFIRELGLNAHYQSTMAAGLIRLEDVLYFVFMIIGALFITTRIIETRRWRA
ncbi:MAG: ABC transporter permease [Anaerolineae bacterium]